MSDITITMDEKMWRLVIKGAKGTGDDTHYAAVQLERAMHAAALDQWQPDEELVELYLEAHFPDGFGNMNEHQVENIKAKNIERLKQMHRLGISMTAKRRTELAPIRTLPKPDPCCHACGLGQSHVVHHTLELTHYHPFRESQNYRECVGCGCRWYEPDGTPKHKSLCFAKGWLR